MFQCLTNQLPFHEETVSDTIDAICKGTIDYAKYHLSDLAKDLLKRLLHPDPSKRLNTRSIHTTHLFPPLDALNHLFLTTQEEVKIRVQNQLKCHDDIIVHDGFDSNSQILFTCLANS